MATIASALNTVFTPSIGTFVVQASGGSAQLQRRQTSGAAWTDCGPEINALNSYLVDNPVAGVEYQFLRAGGTPTVQADQ